MDKKEKSIVAAAISSIEGRITAAEIVSLTGLPVLCVNRCLNSLAYDCGAHLDVSSDGKIAYRFPENFSWLYRTTALQKFFHSLLHLTEKAFLFLIKLVFGTILFVSIIIVYSICFAALEVASVFGNMRNGAGKMRRDFFSLVMIFLKLPDKSEKGKGNKKLRIPSFLENCFAFLFGPADPNSGKDALIWRRIANEIRYNRGVVLPEQLRVWSNKVDFDQFDLSVLVRLDGLPLVTEEGDILYYFPSLVSRQDEDEKLSAMEKSDDKLESASYLEEKCWHFSGINTKDLWPVVALAIVNLVGCNFLYFCLHAIPTLVKQPFLYWGITLLWVYGNTFLVFPLIRIGICALRNHAIIERNVTRKLLADELLYPSEQLIAKIGVSSNTAADIVKQSEDARTIFSTEKDALEQFILEPLIQ